MDMTDMPQQEHSHLLPVQEPYVSPTLLRLAPNLRPNPSTICEACPASVWFSGAEGVKSYCRVMHVVSWSNEEPKALDSCDGEVMANLAREQGEQVA